MEVSATETETETDCDVLFSPPCLSVLLLSCSTNATGRIDRLLKVKIRDLCTAVLVLYNKETGGDELSFVLDLRAIIYKEKEEVDNDRNLCSIFYQIERDSNVIQFEVIPTSADGIRDVQAFDFILGQYAMKDDSLNKDGIVCEGKDRNPNVVAKGFESTGMAVRVALRSGGRYTGHAIRYLGQQYTSVVSGALGKAVEQEAENIRIDSPGESAEVERSASGDAGRLSSDENEVERANRRRVWAEGVHSAATSLTGAVLYPVRWTGRVAAELGGKGGSDRPNSENENALSKVFLDTVGGIGNGVMSVCKGVTEAMGEVGSAIGDSAMHHSVTIHGNEYADTVTKCYVDAASEIGLAGYKVANVTALGWQGVLVNAALEGTTFIVSLYEYLMGPVILQGYMEMMQLPMLKVERFFVVLRPWSIAFYRSAADITRKPYKVVATSLLDTLPKLRLRPAFEGVNGRAKTPETADCSSLLKANNPAGVAPAVPVSGQKLERGAAITTTTEKEEEDQEEDFSYWHRSDYDAFDSDTSVVQKAAAREKAETEEGGSCCTAGTPSAASRCAYSMTVRSALTQLSGGEKSHIELCTLDCSTYILYPPSETIGLWFQELSAASARVETIAKRKSGADEIALYRRLDLYPITSYVTIKVKRFVRSTPKPSMFDMFIRKRSALNTAFSDGASHSGPCQEETAQRPDEFNDSAEDGAGKLPATLRHTSLPASPEERSPENTSGSSGEVGNCESKSGEASEEETKRFPVAEEVGNISDDDDVYECSDFWVSESPDLLSGSYFEISPEDHEQPDAAATHPAIPSGSSGGSPSDLPVPASPHIPLEAIGCSAARGDNIPIAVARCRVSRSDSSNTSSGSSHGGDCKSSVGADSSQDTPTSVPPPLPLSADVTKVNRAFFAPEVQCSVYPVARSGTVLLADKHRIARAPLMTVQQYLSELQTMIAALTDMISASTEESAPGEVATSAAELKEDQTELRCLRIQQLEALQLNYDTYALVNPDKFISDWEVYINLMGAVEVEVGKSVNIFSSKDVSKIEIKLNRRHSQISHFSEWGIAELPIQEMPEGGGPSAVAADAPGTEIWLPVFRRSTGEQLGVLLVEICRKEL